ncbi:MAG: cation:proton antiporter subunit C [Hellea sp.]|jgi:multicomponent Na+:H+ antiporter subunit C|nr:cation:proton antiporter subunit C [Hellea sp.]MBT4996335.1 cation:proton antiporter subunit C [Hellea sp.]MBT5836794.1 cation:proton antiporter subunit C [Hellea sp.]MBT7398543.1 cation:proton antiporter subunit C [Hellea sp.]MDC0421447.1 cation:proton antiporter subunit C [Hellea sp.]
MLSLLLDQYNYAVVIILMMTGLYVVFASRNLIKKLVGLSIFQTSVFLLYITIGKVSGGQPPIVESHGSDHANSETLLFASIGEVDSVAQSSSEVLYSNPLPHVLILTAIVVGVATLAIGLSLVVRVREVYGTIEEDKIEEYDRIYYKEILERQ